MEEARPPTRRRGRKLVAGILIGFAALVIVSIIIAAVTGPGGSKPSASGGQPPASTPSSSSPAVQPASASPSAEPSPDGTYQGSCDYTLANSPDQDDYLIGEIDLANTGNIGTIVHTRISWPQEGSAPIVARKTVRVRAGASKVVRFHVSAGSISGGSNVIDLLQSWQERHGMRDGCKYRAEISGTFGTAS